jgi:hypothetical protein
LLRVVYDTDDATHRRIAKPFATDTQLLAQWSSFSKVSAGEGFIDYGNRLGAGCVFIVKLSPLAQGHLHNVEVFGCNETVLHCAGEFGLTCQAIWKIKLRVERELVGESNCLDTGQATESLEAA